MELQGDEHGDEVDQGGHKEESHRACHLGWEGSGERVQGDGAALVFFESPNRAAATLMDMVEVFGPKRQASLCRELTKTYETVVTLPLAELAAEFDGEDRIRGEVVLVVGPPEGDQNIARTDDDVDALLRALVLEMSPAKAAGEASRMTGRPKGELYQRLLAMK